MPRLAFFLILFSLSSIGLPGLNGFVSEFLVLVGTISSSSDMTSPAGPLGVGYAVFAALGIVLSAIYMLYMCRRLLFGPVKEPEGTPDISADLKQDLCAREIGVLAPIGFFCVLIGVWPNLLLSSIQPAAERQVLARVIQKPAVNEFQIVQQGLPPALTQEEPPGQQADGDQITTWRILFEGESEAAMRDESVSEHGPIVLNQKNSPKATY
jgi:NADH:ubiquinone oxidoreductase subunit 4 (subunit M)